MLADVWTQLQSGELKGEALRRNADSLLAQAGAAVAPAPDVDPVAAAATRGAKDIRTSQRATRPLPPPGENR